jgi:putative hemolysin
MLTTSASLALIFLLLASILSGVANALHRLGKLQTEEELRENSPGFFFKHFLSFFFGKQKLEGLFFSLSFTKHLFRIGYVLTSFVFLTRLWIGSSLVNGMLMLGIIVLIVAVSLIMDFLCSLFGQIRPISAFRFFSPLASIALLCCVPLTVPFFRVLKIFLPRYERVKKPIPTSRIRDKVHELLQESELGAYLDANEQKLILSVVSFKERIAREVMVPRIDIFSLASDTELEEAAQNFLKEGYSRIPVYKDSVDNIIGVLHYKDVLKIYVDQKQAHQKIEKLVKPLLYTPETKKISHLLQEFRNKHIHLAIVVDEWGGTEGIVTIEDILEELVGEIADEYDIGQQELFSALPGGGWIVDAKMSIIDIEEELGIRIPQGSEYDTIGGYIYHRAGAIPAKGWRIHHDEFDLEVLTSSERAVEKIRITPHNEPD